jgi:anti-sigma-K factor RskA
MKHIQLTQDLQEQASLYAAGAMTPGELIEYARHLEEDQCAVCRSEVRELQSAVSMLAFTLPPGSPSPSVKARLMEQARTNAARVPVIELPQPRFRWMQWVTAAVSVGAVAVAFILTRNNNELRDELNLLRSRIAQLEVEIAAQRNDLAMLTSTGVRVVDLAGQGTNVGASGRIFWNTEQKRWFFYVRGLPPVTADKTYQLWFVPTAGNPVSASVFNTGADGSAMIEIPVPDTVGNLRAAAVTTEPAPGLPQPSGQFALLGAM